MTTTHITPEGSTLAPQKVLYTITSGKNTVHVLEGFGWDGEEINSFELVFNGHIKSWHKTVADAQLASATIIANL
jgi:hypothetical protein